MFTKKMSSKVKFLIVVLGLCTMISLVIGGAYLLNEQGLLDSVAGSGESQGERLDGPPPGFDESGDFSERPDRDGAGAGVDSRALMGVLQVVAKIMVVVVAVAGGQMIYNKVARVRRRRRTPAV